MDFRLIKQKSKELKKRSQPEKMRAFYFGSNFLKQGIYCR